MVRITYRKAGVDIDKGDKAVKNIKSLVKSTYNDNVLTELGTFGGMYRFDCATMKKPVLVASTDGVGTKLKVAFMMGKHDTVGEDLVNHCVNDIAVGGATPLFFTDYFATAKLDSNVFFGVIKGFVTGCKNNSCALIGGETAEMPGMYRKGEYDLCGTIVGVVERDKIIDGKKIRKGDICIAVNSNGLHTNGYSLARKVLFNVMAIDSYVAELNCTLGEELLRVHLSYLKLMQQACQKFEINGISHVTGGGVVGNTKRLLNKGLTLRIDWQAWQWPPIFNLIQQLGKVPLQDMRATFNLGVGLIFITHHRNVASLLKMIEQHNYKGIVIGEVQ
jgi:phosphoribosylformylglycinamidine cyclo-ligase